LEPLAKNNINLVNIESRPIPGKFFEYIFYLDFEFSPEKLSQILEIIKELKTKTQDIKVLGIYTKGLS
jgi:prephenate dehydratase